MFAPKEETVANVMNWLTDFGIHDGRIVHSENKGWIAVDVTVEEAEALVRDLQKYFLLLLFQSLLRRISRHPHSSQEIAHTNLSSCLQNSTSTSMLTVLKFELAATSM